MRTLFVASLCVALLACTKAEPTSAPTPAPALDPTGAPDPAPAPPPEPEPEPEPELEPAPEPAPEPPTPPAPEPKTPVVKKKPTPAGDPLLTCAADADCVVVFRGIGCLPSDPMAIARSQRSKIRPSRKEACGMGGDDYLRRREAIERRYSATCKKAQCSLVDRGEQKDRF